MSLEKALQGLTSSATTNATEVTKELLNEKSAMMHTEIRNVKMMNALKVAAFHAKSIGWEKHKDFWELLHTINVVHMIPYKRQRAKEVKEILKAQIAALGIETEKKKGLLR